MATDTVTGTPISAGWRGKKGKQKFVVIVELHEAPGWPIDFVWKKTPVTISIESKKPAA